MSQHLKLVPHKLTKRETSLDLLWDVLQGTAINALLCKSDHMILKLSVL